MKEKLGLYEIQWISNPIMVSMNFNLKKYFKKYCKKLMNKKHNRFRNGSPGMIFEAFASRILALNEHEDIENVNC